MKFQSCASSALSEFAARKELPMSHLRFGVQFLDEALRGIFPDDVVLLGAPSGAGKTQLCCNIALSNLIDGKKVHYIALEAGRFEIERRLKFPMVYERWLSDPNRPKLNGRLTYSSWIAGDHLAELEPYEQAAAEVFETAFRDLFLFYKHQHFGIRELVDAVLTCSKSTDLILIDHVHYFDFDDENENRAIKEIAKTVRLLALEEQKPIVLVAHLRKRDKANEDLVAGLEEFMGSSDLYKIATKVITMAPGRITDEEGWFETFFRIPKNRLDSSPTRFLAREFFNPKRGTYEVDKYQLGWAEQKRSAGFAEIDRSKYPEWARLRASLLSGSSKGAPVVSVERSRKSTLSRVLK